MSDPGGQAGLRVGLFAHRLAGRNPTGIGRYIQELVRALAEVTGPGQDIVVASTPEREDPDWLPATVQRRVVDWPRRPVQMAWSAGLGPRLERSAGPLDAAHLLQPFPPVRSVSPQVVTLHDLFPLEHPEWYPCSERLTHRLSIGLVARRAHTIVVPSRWVAERVQGRLGVEPWRVQVVWHGVSGAFAAGSADQVNQVCARLGLEPERFVVCVGAVSTRKNLISVVRAAPHLDGLPVVLIGPDGQGAQEVDAEIARLDGAARVIRTGYLPDAETGALVQAAGVVLHPALAEGFGFVPLEAMAAGTPVIAARVSSIPEVVGDAAVLIDEPTNPQAWAQAVTELVGDAQRRAALASAGAQRAGQFSWDKTAKRMLEIYANAAGS
jgi:glycosyltransferase involved in cell wall biosynthesis